MHETLGKYQIGDRLGGDAQVQRFRAQHSLIGKAVEVHTVGPAEGPDGFGARRLLRGAKLLGAAMHNNVQGVLDSGSDPHGRPYVVYEALRGESITALVEESPNGIDSERAARIALHVLEGLRALHDQGVVLRTLGPDDVVVESVRPDLDVVKIRAGDGLAQVNDGNASGTARYSTYLAPELRRGESGLDPRVDIYSVGVLLRQLLTGHSRERGKPMPALAARAVQQAAAEDPDERFDSADEFINAIVLFAGAPATELSDEALKADIHYLRLYRDTIQNERGDGEGRIALLPVLLAIEAIYRRFGTSVWARLCRRVQGVQELLPASGNTPVFIKSGVKITLFSQILSTIDRLAGNEDLGMAVEIGRAVCQRGMRRLFPDFPSPIAPEALTAGFPYLWSRLNLGGQASVQRVNHGDVRLVVVGQTDASLEVLAFVAGLLQEALVESGVSESEVRILEAAAVGGGEDRLALRWS